MCKTVQRTSLQLFIHLCTRGCFLCSSLSCCLSSLSPSSLWAAHTHIWMINLQKVLPQQISTTWRAIFRLEPRLCLTETRAGTDTMRLLFFWGGFFLLAPNRDSEHQWRRLPSCWHVTACASTHGPEPRATGMTTNTRTAFIISCFLALKRVFSFMLSKHASAKTRKCTNCFFVLQSYIYLRWILSFSLVTTPCSCSGNHLVRVGKISWFGLKYLFWSLQSWQEIDRHPVKNSRICCHRNSWKYPQVSFKNSWFGCHRKQLEMSPGLHKKNATFATTLHLGRICCLQKGKLLT